MKELEIYGIESRGIANYERVLIQVKAATRSDRFALIGGYSIGGAITPLTDCFLWFGAVDLNVGDWIVVFTGPGSHKVEPHPTSPVHKVYSLYWGRALTMFHRPDAVAVLLDIADISATQPLPLPPAQVHTPITPSSSLLKTQGLLGFPPAYGDSRSSDGNF